MEFGKMAECTNSVMRPMDGNELPGYLGSGLFLVWEESITSKSGKKYRIAIVCQRNHPYSAPAAWILEPKIRMQHHMLKHGRLCVHESYIGPDLTWVLNIRNWTCEWIHCYETGNWPT